MENVNIILCLRTVVRVYLARLTEQHENRTPYSNMY